MSISINNYLYPDKCEIFKSTGAVDSAGEEIFDYKCKVPCELQFGAGGNTSVRPMVFLPEFASVSALGDSEFTITDTDLEVGNKVKVICLNGRIFESTIEQFINTDSEDIPELRGTCIWLKKIPA